MHVGSTYSTTRAPRLRSFGATLERTATDEEPKLVPQIGPRRRSLAKDFSDGPVAHGLEVDEIDIVSVEGPGFERGFLIDEFWHRRRRTGCARLVLVDSDAVPYKEFPQAGIHEIGIDVLGTKYLCERAREDGVKRHDVPGSETREDGIARRVVHADRLLCHWSLPSWGWSDIFNASSPGKTPRVESGGSGEGGGAMLMWEVRGCGGWTRWRRACRPFLVGSLAA